MKRHPQTLHSNQFSNTLVWPALRAEAERCGSKRAWAEVGPNSQPQLRASPCVERVLASDRKPEVDPATYMLAFMSSQRLSTKLETTGDHDEFGGWIDLSRLSESLWPVQRAMRARSHRLSIPPGKRPIKRPLKASLEGEEGRVRRPFLPRNHRLLRPGWATNDPC